MKTNYTKRKLKPGVTLIELTVVIVVILALVSVLFIGAQAYRNGASRSACIVLLRQTHVATRSHQNLNNGEAGLEVVNAPDVATAVLTTPTYQGFMTVVPECPRDNMPYTGWTNTDYPAAGKVDIACPTYGNATADHIFEE